ncbi:MAG TPA: hypothetical protein VMS09_04075 [Paenibacillus sp.]|uniref:hypothetical protein n=1 Tax=Paenibacillus sp. TaxID=58172 RepID=UPI002CB4433E|nr:hypothetical protein [Paenibacillus sp.]HUC91192.1 hypothetical protein [Paenibacillus sp.]
MEPKVARIAALYYGGLSLGAALLFIVLTAGSKYDNVARFGGATWILLLGLIVTMPIFIPYAKKKYSSQPVSKEESHFGHHH